MTREEAFADLKNSLAKETEDIVYRCKDCEKYNLCEYYHGRKETSQICHYFELPERKTGKWIETGYIGNGNYNFECSECHHSDQHTKAVVVPYCWHCGAKMEVEA